MISQIDGKYYIKNKYSKTKGFKEILFYILYWCYMDTIYDNTTLNKTNNVRRLNSTKHNDKHKENKNQQNDDLLFRIKQLEHDLDIKDIKLLECQFLIKNLETQIENQKTQVKLLTKYSDAITSHKDDIKSMSNDIKNVVVNFLNCLNNNNLHLHRLN